MADYRDRLVLQAAAQKEAELKIEISYRFADKCAWWVCGMSWRQRWHL
jgi:hypothetical protein